MRIALVEDDRAEAEQFMSALKGWDPTRSADWFTGGARLFAALDSAHPYTVVFLDIYIPKENGVEIARRLRELSPETEIVFTTTSTEHAVEAFGVGAVHYLVKPVTTAGIREAFDRISQKGRQHRPMLNLKTGREQRTVYLDKIVSLSSDDHFSVLLLSSGERLQVYSALADLIPNLDARFVKIRRGYILNMEYVDSMSAESCRLFNGEIVLLSRRDRHKIREVYNAWLFGRLSNRGGRA